MNSLQIFEFKETIKRYINEQDIPAEIKRMCLVEVLEDIRGEAQKEIISLAQERESKEEN